MNRIQFGDDKNTGEYNDILKSKGDFDQTSISLSSYW